MKKVEIYSTPSCHYCNLAKDFFKAEGVAYIEYDVAEDLEKRKEMVERTQQMGVPVIIITDQDGDDIAPVITIGFNEDKLRDVLEIAA
jgi:glutaredoxin 3